MISFIKCAYANKKEELLNSSFDLLTNYLSVHLNSSERGMFQLREVYLPRRYSWSIQIRQISLPLSQKQAWVKISDIGLVFLSYTVQCYITVELVSLICFDKTLILQSHFEVTITSNVLGASLKIFFSLT